MKGATMTYEKLPAMSKDIRRMDIVLSDSQGTFKAGDNLSGTLYLDVVADTKLKGIRLTLHGVARCSWDNQRTQATFKGMTSGSTYCKNTEVYLDDEIPIPKFVPGMMKPGRYNFSFNYRLPPYLPNSFEGQYGKVHYWLKCNLERSWKGDNEITRPFTVKGVLDLNAEPQMRLPLQEVTDTLFGGCCCRGGHVEAILGVQRQGFVPGESIPFFVKIQNHSTGKINNVRLYLYQFITYKAENQLRKSQNTIMAVFNPDVKKGDDLTWEGELKNIPQLVPSHLGAGCRFIEVKYQLHLTAKQGMCGNKVNVVADITIGTVPLRKTEGVEKAKEKHDKVITKQNAATNNPVPAMRSIGTNTVERQGKTKKK